MDYCIGIHPYYALKNERIGAGATKLQNFHIDAHNFRQIRRYIMVLIAYEYGAGTPTSTALA
jgi:hypothetical protein